MTVLEKIMKGSLEVFVEKGFDGSSISLITKRSKVSNGAIYHHFNSKEDIIKKLYIDITSELNDYLIKNLEEEHNLKEKIYLIWSSIIKWSIENYVKKKFIDMFVSSPHYLEVDKSQVEDGQCLFGTILEEGFSQGYIKPMDPELIYRITTGFTDASISYLTLYPHKNNREFFNTAFASYWRSIADF